MIEAVSIRRALLLHILASSAAVYIVLLRTVDDSYLSHREHWVYMLLALASGGVQAALLVGRCAMVDWWVRRNNPAPSRRRAFLHRHAELATGAVLAAVVGAILVYDGFWMLDESYPRPAFPALLDLLWFSGYVVGGTGVLVYIVLACQQIGQIYNISRKRRAAALAIGFLPEFGFFGLGVAAWVSFLIVYGPSLA